MSNEEFLRRLEGALMGRVPQEDVDDAMNYHREYFAEAGENAAEGLPTPEAVAEQIVREREAYLRKARFRWARPAIIVALCVGLVLTAAVSWGVKGFFRNLWSRTFRQPQQVTYVAEDFVSSVEQIAYAGTALTTTERGSNIYVVGTLEPFDGIVVEGVSDGVSVIPGDSFTIDMWHNKREAVDCEVAGNILYITGNMDGVLSTGFKGGNISITVPYGVELFTVRVDTDMGDITLDNVTAGEVDLDADVGNIVVSGGTFRSLDCDSEVGEVTVTAVTADYLKCYADVGQVQAMEFIATETDLETNLGSVTAIVLGAREDYALELEVDLGEIKVDGQKVSSPYSSSGNSRVLAAKADVGSVTVDFTEASSVPSPPDPPSPPEAPELSEAFQ